jgi:hypothetical protein
MGATPHPEHDTRLPKGEQEIPAALPPAALTVKGSPRELVASLQSLVRNDAVSRAILVLFPDATSDISVRLSKVKEVTLASSRGEVSIELPSATRIPRAQDMITRTLVRELVFSTLTHFARTGSEIPSSRDLLLNLAELASKKPIANETDLRRELTMLVKSTVQDISTHIHDCSKRATRSSTGNMGSIPNALKNIDSTFDLLARLRALSWASVEKDHADLFENCGAQCLEALNVNFMQHWDSCHRASDLDRAAQTISLYEKVTSELKRCGFAKTPPPYLLPLREVAQTTNLDQRAALLRRGGLTTNTAPKPNGFATHFLRLLPEAVASLRATVQMERDIQSWTAPTQGNTHLIHAELFAAIPGAVDAVKALKTIPDKIPPELSTFTRTVGYLKHHGGAEGLETHCMIISPGPWIDATKKKAAVEDGELHRQLLSLAQTNIRGYLDLVEFTATWAHRSTEVKIDLVQTYQEKLNTIIARGLWGSIAEVLFVIHSTIGGELKHEDISDKLHSDRIAELAKPAADLSIGIRTPEVSTILRALATQTIPHLAAAKRALEINTLPWPEILDRAHELPTTFEESQFGEFVKGFVADLNQALLVRAEEFATETNNLLSSAYDEGDSTAFCRAASAALACVAKPSYPENAKMKILVALDGWMLKFINLARDAVEYELTNQEEALRAAPTSQTAKASGIETLSFFVEAMTPLHQLIANNRNLIQAARLNHYHSTAIQTLHRSPLVSSAFISTLREQLALKDPSPQLIEHARFFLSLHSIGSRLSHRAQEDLASIKKLISSS